MNVLWALQDTDKLYSVEEKRGQLLCTVKHIQHIHKIFIDKNVFNFCYTYLETTTYKFSSTTNTNVIC